MNTFNRNNTPQNFNFNDNNLRGFPGNNNNNNMMGFSANNNMRSFPGSNNNNMGGFPRNNNMGGFPGNNNNNNNAMGGFPGNNSNNNNIMGGFPGNNNNNNNTMGGFPGNNSNNNNTMGGFPGNNNNNTMGGFPGNNNNNNSMGGFPGNNNTNTMGSFPGNNSSFMEQPLQNNWGTNTGQGTFWSGMNNDRNDGFNRPSGRLNSPPPPPPPLFGLLDNYSKPLNILVGSGSIDRVRGGIDGGRESITRRSNSRYSPPNRSNARLSPPRRSTSRYSPPRRSNSRYSPPRRSNPRNSPPRRSNVRNSPLRSRNTQPDQSGRPATISVRRNSSDKGRAGSVPSLKKRRAEILGPRREVASDVPVKKTRLSGAGKRRYRNFLQQGYSPEKARQKALEGARPQVQSQRAPQRPGTKPPQSQAKGGTSVKRPAHSVDSKIPADAKKAKPSVPKPKPLIDPNNPRVPMVVMPVDYPSSALNQEELVELETAVTDEIAKGWDIEPEFSGTYFKAGRLHITCINEATSKWLVERVPHLENWKGVPLKACSKDALRVNTIKISFPRSAGQDVNKTLALVTAQNKDINTSSWKIIDHKDEGGSTQGSQLVTIVIDDESLGVIKKKDNFLNYRFGRVFLQSVQQQYIKHAPKGKEVAEKGKVNGKSGAGVVAGTIKSEPKTPTKEGDSRKVNNEPAEEQQEQDEDEQEQDEDMHEQDEEQVKCETEQNAEDDEDYGHIIEDDGEEYGEGEVDEDDYDDEQEI